jgi:hypothetical protein
LQYRHLIDVGDDVECDVVRELCHRISVVFDKSDPDFDHLIDVGDDVECDLDRGVEYVDDENDEYE